MGAYKAWEDQCEKADAAGRASDLSLHQTHDYQNTVTAQRITIDNLTTLNATLLARTNNNQQKNFEQNQTSSIGNNNTIYGNVPARKMGSGNTIIGATDSHGNTIITQAMTVGYGARGGQGSIVIGAFSGSGAETNSITTNQSPR